MWMNEYEIEQTLRFTAEAELPNMRRGAEVLSNLKEWTNANSDGWPYWKKPSMASQRLQTALYEARREYLYGHTDVKDFTDAELKKFFTPIKSFLTRQGVDHSEIF